MADCAETAKDAPLVPAETGRLVLAGDPVAGALPSPSVAQRPKDLLLALAAAEATARGIPVLRANPHVMPPLAAPDGLVVLHGAGLALDCPVPKATNLLLLDGEDLLALAEERQREGEEGLLRRKALLMDRILAVAPAEEIARLLPGVAVAAPALAGLLRHLPALASADARTPVRWMACALEGGPYNHLRLRQGAAAASAALPQPLPLLLRAAARQHWPSLLTAATPDTLGDIAPALRAFAAVAAETPEPRRPMLCLLFFGTPSEFDAALAGQAAAVTFADTVRWPGIRILFAPFAAAEVLGAMAEASAVLDTCHGGVVAALAEAMALPRRAVLDPGGRLAVWEDGMLATPAPDWAGAFSAEGLLRRRRTPDRGGDRALASAIDALLRETVA